MDIQLQQIGFLPHNIRYTSSCFIKNVLQQFFKKISNFVCTWMISESIILPQEHKKTLEFCFKYPHLPYSHEFSPSDFFLLGNVTGWLGDQKFNSFDELKEWINPFTKKKKKI